MVQTNQRIIQVGKLYKVWSLGQAYIEQNINPSVWIDTGAIDIYGSDSDTAPAALSEMTLDSGDTAATGKKQISTLPTYMAIAQNGAVAPTEIVLTGVEAIEVGDIA